MEVVVDATRGGVGIVVLREPGLRRQELRALYRRIRDSVAPETTLLIHGDPELANELGSGLHLPARAPLAPERGARGSPYGRSVHDDRELKRALDDGATYLLVGTIFPTVSKPGRAAAGVRLVERACRQAHPLPVYAIGGISVGRVPLVIHSGAWGVACCGALLQANEPERVAEAMTLALEVSVG